MSIEAVRAFYDGDPDREWLRLGSNGLEFAVSLSRISQALPPGSRILDIGGGPGRYSLALAAAGHSVVLADISAASIAYAQEEATQRGISITTHVADARDLAAWRDEEFDAVLCLGPLYHLMDENDRALAVTESLRVLRPGGIAFFAFIARHAVAHFTLKHAPEDVEQAGKLLDRILDQGRYEPAPGEDFFTHAVFTNIESIADFMAPFGLLEHRLWGAEGGMAQSDQRIMSLPDPARTAWIARAVELAETSFGLWGSEHIVYQGCKPPA
ncbi:MAG: class I SAM-dependent methyltransferase [Pseudomonadota bacterium]